MVTIKDLELVRSVAKHGSLTAASRELYISQSAASQRLKNLSERLNVTVFERRAGGLKMTAAGRRLHAAAQVIAQELRATRQDLSELSRHDDGTLRIATQCFTCYRWLPFVIRSMTAEYPRLAVDVVPAATDRPYDALKKHDIDIAVVSTAESHSGLTTFDLFGDEFFAVMNETHPLANRSFLTPQNFSGQSLILYTGARHAIVDLVLEPARVSGFDVVQVRITEAIVELARAGRGIAIIAGWALDDLAEKQGLKAVRITRGGFRRTWRAVIAGQATPPITTFVDELRRIGSALQNPSWRAALRPGYA